jgi:hypothetical protein
MELKKLEMWIESPYSEKRVLQTMVNEPGGGGWGDPLDRDVRRVQDDVIDGIVLTEAVKDLYGVVIDSKTSEVRIEATERLKILQSCLRYSPVIFTAFNVTFS